jgi:hypothetical protein
VPAYSGQRRFLDDPAFAAWSITDHASTAYRDGESGPVSDKNVDSLAR